MISKKYSIEEFVEGVKTKDPAEVVVLAIQEATAADRAFFKTHQQAKKDQLQTYSQQLKLLINYHRFTVKLRRSKIRTYDLYVKYWGDSNRSMENSLSTNLSADKPNFRETA